MANVVKHTSSPQKWLVSHQQRMRSHFNRVIKEQEHDEARAFVDAFKKMRFTVKNAILDFCLKKESIFQAGELKSMRAYKACLVKETIMLAIQMKQILAREAIAIDTLAHKLASNILNSEITDHFTRLSDIETELARAFSLRILMPASHLSLVTTSFQPLLKILDQSAFLGSHNHDKGAQIWVCTTDMSFALDFDEADIESIFSGVIEWIPRA